MSVKFVLNHSIIETPCVRGLNLLGHAQVEELEIGSRCGGHGICGGDRIRISVEERSKFSPPTSHERGHLTPQEIEAGWRLACQCFPSQDGLEISVTVPADNKISKKV